MNAVRPRNRPQHRPGVPVPVVASWVEAMDSSVTSAVTALEELIVSGLTLDSRSVQPGDLFLAPPGARLHGAQFAATAQRLGASAVLTDPEGAELCAAAGLRIPVLVVPSPRAVVGSLAARLYGDPATRLAMIGVTGTQGKTTVTRLAQATLEQAGFRAGVVGTVGTRVAGQEVPSALTTPEAPDLHALFAVMVEEAVEVCAMEVSSHALVMGRVDSVVFDVACFTNLGRDHLDFHPTLEDYFAAKARLFTPRRAKQAVVNLDDSYGRRLIEGTELPVTTYSVSSSQETDWWVSGLRAEGVGSRFTVHGPHGEAETLVALPGRYNVGNALCALAALSLVGHPIGETAPALARVPGVPGRMEAIEAGQPFLAFVDYAHKPDAVEAVLSTLRVQVPGRLLMVLGAGGDRDRGKRPVMAAAAASLADVLVVTDDNPRTEDPAAIRGELLAGIPTDSGCEVHEVGDRAAAIRLVARLAGHGDAVVIAGKGHERGQDVGGHVRDFDDRVELRSALTALAREAEG